MFVRQAIRTMVPLLTLLLLSTILTSQSASAQIIVDRPPIDPGVFTDPTWLRLDHHRVTVDITDQVARTTADLKFTNAGDALAEGTFIFPLPAESAVDDLILIIDGRPYEAKILSAAEARAIYNEIVRQYRDPALLEYVGTQAVQANVFPIPPGESRQVQIRYSQLLVQDNGLIAYHYPMSGARSADLLSISVTVRESSAIGPVYSPTHNLAIVREGSNGFTAGYEASFTPGTDFTLYYGLASDDVDLKLLTYRDSAAEDGFFLLLIEPPLEVSSEVVPPKDVVLVLDQSGSMDGVKWDQARDAAAIVLRSLNPQDRFNLVVFSTGVRVYSLEMLAASEAENAITWMNGLIAEGGTNINAALTDALALVAERPTALLFLTDGEATEGITDTAAILSNLGQADKPNARIFTFGVGDDVNTLLLDAIVRDFRGAGTYVRPGQRIDEAVASLYNKIDSPVLTDVTLSVDGVIAELLYPQSLSDIFAGEQVTIVGRYRGGESVTVTLSGTEHGTQRSLTYANLSFPALAHGEAFIARLWATRRIGDLLNTIRLNGENSELVDSIVSLSLRYGIITPYTSFLIEEDDILTQAGRERAMEEAEDSFGGFDDEVSGAAAVDRAVDMNAMSAADAPDMQFAAPKGPATDAGEGDVDDPGELAARGPVQTVEGKTFLLLDDTWTDSAYAPDSMTLVEIVFLSDAYFDLLDRLPALAPYFALGQQLIVVYEGTAYAVVAA